MSRGYVLAFLAAALTAGCGDALAGRPAPLFGAWVEVEGESVGAAVIDTGGGYELILRETFGLTVVGTANVLAFGGQESVSVTEGFDYVAEGWPATADGALVGVSVCDCNGLGFFFFRKTGAVLELDFTAFTARFLTALPEEGVAIPFASPPPQLPAFDTSFVEVEVSTGMDSRKVLALIDTGSTQSVMRRGLVAGTSPALLPDRLDVLVSEPHLGTVGLQIQLFDTPGLPDMILGTDVMPVWADRWYFAYETHGGTMRAARREPPLPNDDSPLARGRHSP